MQLKDIIFFLESKYNINLAEKWDNPGLILGREENNISKIILCLDISNDVVQQAIDNNVDLIISHHPLIFSGVKKITSNTILGEKILKLIENSISVYSIHTNIDSAIDGLNDYILEKISLEGKKEILFLNEMGTGGLGRTIELNTEMTVEKIIKIIKRNLGLENIRLAGRIDKSIKKIAILTGSGGSQADELNKDIDMYITGDLKHHETLDALELGITLIDLGHYESEIIFSELLSRELQNFFPGAIIRAKEKEIFTII